MNDPKKFDGFARPDETPKTFAELKPPGYWSALLGYFVPVTMETDEEFWARQPRGLRRRHGKLKD
jgi:hypothetical protein